MRPFWKIRLALVGLFVGCLGVSRPAAAQTFVNGGFEAPSISPSYVSTVSPTGWTVTNSALWNSPNLNAAGGDGATADGVQFLGLNNNGLAGTAAQTFTVQPNTTYRVSFGTSIIYNGGRYNYGISALATGGSLQTYSFTSSGSKTKAVSVDPFATQTYQFTTAAAQTTATLTFTSTTPFANAYGTALDGVSVTPAPEPAQVFSLGLGGLGLVGLMLTARRRTSGEVA